MSWFQENLSWFRENWFRESWSWEMAPQFSWSALLLQWYKHLVYAMRRDGRRGEKSQRRDWRSWGMTLGLCSDRSSKEHQRTFGEAWVGSLQGCERQVLHILRELRTMSWPTDCWKTRSWHHTIVVQVYNFCDLLCKWYKHLVYAT